MKKYKVIRKNWPKVTQYKDHTGATRYKVDCRSTQYHGEQDRFTFSTEKEALEKARLIESQVDAQGIGNVNLSIDRDIVMLQGRLTPFKKTLDDAVNYYINHLTHEQSKDESLTVWDLGNRWYQDKLTNSLNKLRSKSLVNIKTYFHQFRGFWPETIRIKQLTEQDCQNFITRKKLDGNTPSPKTCWTRQNYLNNFLNWCVKKEYLDKSPTAKMDTVQLEDKLPSYLSVDKCVELMRITNEPENQCMLGYVSLLLFAGVRPDEVQKDVDNVQVDSSDDKPENHLIRWNNINLDHKELFVSRKVAKTKKDRRFIMSDNLIQWLTYFKSLGFESFVPKDIPRKFKLITDRLNGDFKPDILRHTFATMFYATHENKYKLAELMGNTPDIVEKHYKRSISLIGNDKFWSILPPTIK